MFVRCLPLKKGCKGFFGKRDVHALIQPVKLFQRHGLQGSSVPYFLNTSQQVLAVGLGLQ